MTEKLAPAALHMLLSTLVVTSPAPDVLPSILTDYTYDSELDITDGLPQNVPTQLEVPEGEARIYNDIENICMADMAI